MLKLQKVVQLFLGSFGHFFRRFGGNGLVERFFLIRTVLADESTSSTLSEPQFGDDGDPHPKCFFHLFSVTALHIHG